MGQEHETKTWASSLQEVSESMHERRSGLEGMDSFLQQTNKFELFDGGNLTYSQMFRREVDPLKYRTITSKDTKYNNNQMQKWANQKLNPKGTKRNKYATPPQTKPTPTLQTDTEETGQEQSDPVILAHIRGTPNNPSSSRGTLYFFVDIEYKDGPGENGTGQTGTIIVVDLAGSEDPA